MQTLMNNYEDFLKMAYSQGWRDPVQVTDLEIKAYEAGMIAERNRVLSIFKDISDKKVMRILDLQRYLYRINNPNNPV